MRALPFCFLLLTTLGFGQTRVASLPVAPVPPDPHEIVSSETHIPADAAERGALVTLMSRAADNYALHSRGTPAHALQINFNAASSTLYQGGPGSLRETWISGQNWRWDGTLPGYTLQRISSNGAIYDQNPDGMIPMRIKMLASAVFAPLGGAPRRETIRTAAATFNGVSLTCILTSAQGNEQIAARGRQWYETEYCIDPATGLLNIYSIAPGIYAIYDYSSALHFHDRVLPGRVTVYENGSTTLDAHLASITDISSTDTSPFTPTAQMIAQGPAIVLGEPERFALPAFSPGIAYVQPVIVHAVFDQHGTVRESEVLQNSSVSSSALDEVNKMTLPQLGPASGASSLEREVYVNVRFMPAPQFGPQGVATLKSTPF
jgi:hypothetical protein